MKFSQYIREAKEKKSFDVRSIENDTVENDNFRKVLYTGNHLQLVVMSLKPGEEIGREVHNDTDQFFRIDKGKGKVVVDDGDEQEIEDGSSIIIKSGTYHNIINTSENEDLKLYTIYSPPHHPPGTIHKTKEEAEEYEKEEK